MVRAGVVLDYETKASYTIDLVATDTVGNHTETVTVAVTDVNDAPEDTTAPVITLVGDAVVVVEVGDAYSDGGATVTDNVDSNLVVNAVGVGAVDTTQPGTYTISYNVSDTAGNVSTKLRNVIVEEELAINRVSLPAGMRLSEGGIMGFIDGNMYMALDNSSANTYNVMYKYDGANFTAVDMPAGGWTLEYTTIAEVYDG